MTVYLILMALVLILAYPLVERKPSFGKKLCYVIVTFGAMYLISVLRYGLGNDYYSYIYIFRNIKEASWIDMFNMGYEPGFTVITKLISVFTDNVNVLYAIYALLILVPTAYAVFRHSEKIWMSTMMFICLTFFYCSLSFIRQSIAFAIILCAYRYMKEHNHFMVLLFVFFACLFHSTVIVMIPLYLIAVFIRPTKITVPLYGILTALVYIFSWDILKIAVKILPQYKNYLELNFITQGYNPVYMILPAIIMVLALIAHFTGYGKANPKASSIFTNFAIFNFIIWFIATKHFVIERFSMYVYIVMIMFIPSIANYYMNCAKVYFARKKNPEAVVEFDKTVDEVLREKKAGKTTAVNKKAAIDNNADELDEDTKRILREIMAEKSQNGEDSDAVTTEETDSEPELQEKAADKYAPDERYFPQNRVFRQYKNKVLSVITNPVTVTAVFMAAVVLSNQWYNYFGLTVSKKGFHGVVPYRSIVPQYNELVLSTEQDEQKNKLLVKEENFLSYIYRLKENENFTVFMTAKADTVSGLNDGSRTALAELGLVKLAEEQNNKSRYIAVIEGGKVIYEAISDKDFEYSTSWNNRSVNIKSVGAGKTSSITIGGSTENYSVDENGLNIAVFDNISGKLIDMVRFKTYYVMLSATR
ncbi:MAG: EpsG family protein [Ruminiclostridium sp.]